MKLQLIITKSLSLVLKQLTNQPLIFILQGIPVLEILVFLAKNLMDFLDFLPRSWQLFLTKHAGFYKNFQDREKKSQSIFGVLSTKSKIIQYLGKKFQKHLPFYKIFELECDENEDASYRI